MSKGRLGGRRLRQEREQELTVEGKALTARLEQANERITALNTSVMIEHEEGFNKALRQASFLLGVDPYAKGFDVMKKVYEGNFVPHDEIPDNEEEPAAEEDAGEGEQVATDGNDGANVNLCWWGGGELLVISDFFFYVANT